MSDMPGMPGMQAPEGPKDASAEAKSAGAPGREGRVPAGLAAVDLSPERMQLLGMRTAQVKRGSLKFQIGPL